MYHIATFSLLVLGFATLTAVVAVSTPIETTGCRRTKCLQNNCPNVSCSYGIVFDNVNCPCCYRCAKQQAELCNVNTDNNHTDYHYCDVGLHCKRPIEDGTTGQLLGRCEGRRSQICVHGHRHRKGCLTCECNKGSGAELCWDDRTGITCPNLTCPFKDRYRPVDKCCVLCGERPATTEPCFDPEISLLGDVSVIDATRKDPISVIFRGNCLELVNKSSQLSVFHNGNKLKDPNLSVKIVRLPHTISEITDAIEIIFTIKKLRKIDAGEYTLQYSNASDSFILNVQDLRLLNCTFDDGLCNWRSKTVPPNSLIGWWRRSGPIAPGTGPQTGHGGSGDYIYVQASRLDNGTKALLKSLVIPFSFHPTNLTFAYYMQGSDVGSLTVRQTPYSADGTIQVIEKWSKQGDQDDVWHTAMVPIGPITGYKSSRITFRACVGQNGYIALDSIMFLY